MQKITPMRSCYGRPMYALNTRGYNKNDAKAELLRKVRNGEIPAGKYCLTDNISLRDHDHHWYAEKMD